jgi:hypothetical protein
MMGYMDDKPVTRAELHEALGATKREIIDAVRELVRDAQTEILKAFFPHQEATNIRIRAVETNLSNVDTGLSERMAVMERRLLEIEKKLLLNPPAA